MRCTGPYTRVFLDKKDAARCIALLETLPALGLTVEEATVPKGNGRTEDFVFNARLDGLGGTWTLGLAKFLGPKKLLRQTHVYEVTLARAAGDAASAWQGHLFDTRLEPLFARLRGDWPRLAADDVIAGWVPREESHEVRIDLCIG